MLFACGKKDKNEMEEIADPVDPMQEPIAATPVPVIKVPERIETKESINAGSAQSQQQGEEKVVIGLAVCDDFLNRYRACYMDMPANIQQQLIKGLKNTETALQRAAEEGNMERLTTACEQLEIGISKAMIAQGCPWY